eukprot:CAMPEP_0119406464 /NCGR_PEP_ID=MMETSP1335-20130426/777_1 /TAXON_ID=259385 /ORGANISM="Chrysoculter rhomboideus, Strain RCC1486" /LENGTH=138 /DNA_ID=CAMNT_0007430543 /DNA_START=135 /DNA_END=550 /DNA_ORIENTATION=-
MPWVTERAQSNDFALPDGGRQQAKLSMTVSSHSMCTLVSVDVVISADVQRGTCDGLKTLSNLGVEVRASIRNGVRPNISVQARLRCLLSTVALDDGDLRMQARDELLNSRGARKCASIDEHDETTFSEAPGQSENGVV